MLASPLSPHNATTQLTTFKSYVALIADPTPGIAEKKLKAAQELSENFETVVSSPQYPQFLADALRVFMKILEEGEPQFIADQNMQQLRKLLLEIIHRIPSNEHLKKYVQQILSLMFKLIKIENEENVLVCLKIIMELHKQYRPQMNEEQYKNINTRLLTTIQDFLKFVNQIYTSLPGHLNKIFEPRSQIKVKDVTEINVEALLQETFTVTTIMTDKKNADNQSVSYNIIPRGVLSLKVLAELPIIVVLMYQLYKPNVHQEVANFIPLIMNTITLQPQPQHRAHPAFNKEVFVDFVAAQIKTLSFLAYIVRIFQEQVQNYSQKMVQGHLSLLSLCPQEVAHLRKELLIAAKHILATDLRHKFVSVIDKLFDESILIGNGWTTYESLSMDLIYWSSLPGVPKKLKWPVKVTAFGQYTSVYCKSDDAQVKMEQLIPFPGEFEKLKQHGLVSLAKRPRDKIAFLDDVEWALKQVQNSRGKDPEVSTKSPLLKSQVRRRLSPPVGTKRARSKSPMGKHSPSPVRSNKAERGRPSSRSSRSAVTSVRDGKDEADALDTDSGADSIVDPNLVPNEWDMKSPVRCRSSSPPVETKRARSKSPMRKHSPSPVRSNKAERGRPSSRSSRSAVTSARDGKDEADALDTDSGADSIVDPNLVPNEWDMKSPVRCRSSSPPVETKRARSKSPMRKHSPSPVRSNKAERGRPSSRSSRSAVTSARDGKDEADALDTDSGADSIVDPNLVPNEWDMKSQVRCRSSSPPVETKRARSKSPMRKHSPSPVRSNKAERGRPSSRSSRSAVTSARDGKDEADALDTDSGADSIVDPNLVPNEWDMKSPVRCRSSSPPVETKRARSKSPMRKHSPSPVRSNKAERGRPSSRSSRSAVTSARDGKDEADALDTDSGDDSIVDPNFVPNESDIESDIEDHACDILDTEQYVCASESDSSDCIQYFPALTIEKTPADCRLMKDQAGTSVSSDSPTAGSFVTLSDLHYQSNHEHDLLDEGDIERDKTYPDVFIRKMKQSKNDRRIYDNYHCCFVCKKMKSNIRKHILVHKENDTVKKILRLQLKNDKTQQKEIERLKTILRNSGDNAHNQVVFERKKGKLIVSRRPASFNLTDFGPCPNCFEWIKIGVCVTKHQIQCAGAIKDGQKLSKGQMVVRSNVLKGVLSLEASAGLLSHVYPIMTRDRITEVAQRDSLIVGLGNFSYRQSVNNKGKRKYITSSRMRGAARLLKSLKEKHGMDMSMKDFLNVDYFESCVEAALSCASPDEVDTEDLKHPSAALKAGNDLFQMADIQIGIAVQDRDVREKEELESFIFLLKKNWRNRVARLANMLLRQRKMLKKVQLPNPSDLQKLASYLKEKLSSKSYDTYRSAAEYSLCRLLLYNKRRSGELENTLKISYHARSETLDESDEAVIGDLTPLEKRLLGSQEIMKIEGKGQQTVPVIIPTDAAHALEYIMDPAVRKDAGIKEDNPYLFATRGDGSMRAYETLKRVCTEVEVVAPDTLTSVNLRKYFATMTQVIGLKDHELGWLCKHLGHTTDVHKLHYRAASGYIERINIGKLMLLQDFNVASKFKGQSLEDIRVEDILETAEKKDTGLGDEGEVEQEEAPDGQFLIDNSVSQSHRKNKKVVRQRWSLEEEEELNQLFEKNIRDRVCPSKQELHRAVSISREKSGKIHLRTLDNIKKKVWNMYKKFAE